MVITQSINGNITEKLQKGNHIAWDTILDNAFEGYQIISFDWRYLYVNNTVIQQGHQTKEGLLGHTMMQVYPGIEKTDMFVHLQQCMELRELRHLENEFIYTDGQKGWFELRMQPIPEGVLILSFDITERKKSEENLLQRAKIIQQKDATDEAILASIGEGLLATDEEGNTIVLNRSAQEMLKYTTQEVLGKPLTGFLRMEDENAQPILDKNRPNFLVLSNGKPIVNTKGYYLRKDEKKFPVNITVTPILIDGKVKGTIEVFRDVSKEKAIDKSKSEFVSIVSHALRTPLGIVKWYLEAIGGDGYLKEAPDILINYLDEIYKNNERLLMLVRNLLSVSRIDQGKIKYTPQKVNLIELMKIIVKDMQIAALKDHVSISLKIKQKTVHTLFIDPLRLREVIENLLSNAIKYSTHHKNVEVLIDKQDDTVFISVKDTGIGISEEDKKKIFSKFFRAENAIISNTEGSGLGLYVVKSYIDGWGGTISVESNLGKGSTFTITIPIMKKKEGGDI